MKSITIGRTVFEAKITPNEDEAHCSNCDLFEYCGNIPRDRAYYPTPCETYWGQSFEGYVVFKNIGDIKELITEITE